MKMSLVIMMTSLLMILSTSTFASDRAERIVDLKYEISELKDQIKTEKYKRTGAITVAVSAPFVSIFFFSKGFFEMMMDAFLTSGNGKESLENVLDAYIATGALLSEPVAIYYIHMTGKQIDKFYKKLIRLELQLERLQELDSLTQH